MAQRISCRFLGLLILPVLALTVACEARDDEYEPLPWDGIELAPDSIVGGAETNYQSWKAVVGLWYDQGGGFGNICTATLIDSEVVLTAAHCVYLPGEGIDAVSFPGFMDIVGGSNIAGLGRIVYSKPVSIVTHPDWKGDLVWGAADLAVIKLATPITSLVPFEVRAKTDLPAVGEEGRLVGYGLVSSSEPYSAGVHRVGSASILSLREEYNLMELGDPNGTCQGDSGGPFFTKRDGQWVLTGVTSFGTVSECLADRDSWDVNAVNYWDWIDGAMFTLVGHGLLGEGEGEGDGEGEDGPPLHPFGSSSDNPVDWSCSVAVRASSWSLLGLFLSL